MRYGLISSVLLLLSIGCSQLQPSGPCPIQRLSRLSIEAAECQFTLGRTAYTDRRFADAATHWRRVISIEPQSTRDMDVYAAALGTLGFLYYSGWGVQQDIERAMELLKRSVKFGGLEARRHLGVAYEDENNKFFDRVAAYAWYRSVEHFYKPFPDEVVAQRVLQRARQNAEDLKAGLTAEQLEKAEKLAWTIE